MTLRDDLRKMDEKEKKKNNRTKKEDCVKEETIATEEDDKLETRDETKSSSIIGSILAIIVIIVTVAIGINALTSNSNKSLINDSPVVTNKAKHGGIPSSSLDHAIRLSAERAVKFYWKECVGDRGVIDFTTTRCDRTSSSEYNAMVFGYVGIKGSSGIARYHFDESMFYVTISYGEYVDGTFYISNAEVSRNSLIR